MKLQGHYFTCVFICEHRFLRDKKLQQLPHIMQLKPKSKITYCCTMLSINSFLVCVHHLVFHTEHIFETGLPESSAEKEGRHILSWVCQTELIFLITGCEWHVGQAQNYQEPLQHQYSLRNKACTLFTVKLFCTILTINSTYFPQQYHVTNIFRADALSPVRQHIIQKTMRFKKINSIFAQNTHCLMSISSFRASG